MRRSFAVILALMTVLALQGCSAKELIYDLYDDDALNDIEERIEQATDEARSRLRDRLNEARDSDGDRRAAILKALARELGD